MISKSFKVMAFYLLFTILSLPALYIINVVVFFLVFGVLGAQPDYDNGSYIQKVAVYINYGIMIAVGLFINFISFTFSLKKSWPEIQRSKAIKAYVSIISIPLLIIVYFVLQSK